MEAKQKKNNILDNYLNTFIFNLNTFIFNGFFNKIGI